MAVGAQKTNTTFILLQKNKQKIMYLDENYVKISESFHPFRVTFA